MVYLGGHTKLMFFISSSFCLQIFFISVSFSLLKRRMRGNVWSVRGGATRFPEAEALFWTNHPEDKSKENDVCWSPRQHSHLKLSVPPSSFNLEQAARSWWDHDIFSEWPLILPLHCSLIFSYQIIVLSQVSN